jgi:hypothetical protein
VSTFHGTLQQHPELTDEVEPIWFNFRFDGQGQRETPVADARGIVRDCEKDLD